MLYIVVFIMLCTHPKETLHAYTRRTELATYQLSNLASEITYDVSFLGYKAKFISLLFL